MNEFLRLEREAKRYKEQYPKGTRLELISMEDPQAVPPGTRGTVQFVDDIGSIHMNWDNGRTLALVPKKIVLENSRSRKLSKSKMLCA